jgi:hypothetical protein
MQMLYVGTIIDWLFFPLKVNLVLLVFLDGSSFISLINKLNSVSEENKILTFSFINSYGAYPKEE